MYSMGHLQQAHSKPPENDSVPCCHRLAAHHKEQHFDGTTSHRGQKTRNRTSSELSWTSSSTSSTASSELSDPDATLEFLRQTYGDASRAAMAHSDSKSGTDRAGCVCLMEFGFLDGSIIVKWDACYRFSRNPTYTLCMFDVLRLFMPAGSSHT